MCLRCFGFLGFWLFLHLTDDIHSQASDKESIFQKETSNWMQFQVEKNSK